MLTKRDLIILEKIVYNNYTDINLLSEEYGISNRNIRYIVNNLNFYLKKYKLLPIIIKKNKLFQNIKVIEFEYFLKNIDEKIYFYSKSEREKFILIKYLFDEKTTILDLEKELNVSRPTIKSDLINIEKYINNYDLTFVNKNNKFFIEGNEKKYRHLKFSLFNQDNNEKYLINRKEKDIFLKYKEKYYYNFFEIFNNIEKEQKIRFSNDFKNLMNNYLIITRERIFNNHIINKKDNELFLEKLDEFKIISKNFKDVFDCNLKYELLHITEYFLSGYYNDRFSEDMIRIEKFTTKFVLDLKEELDINLNQNFVDGILKYLIPAIYRIKNNLIIKKNEKIMNFDIYKIVKRVVLNNNYYLKEPLRENEIIYLSNYVKEFYNKNKISIIELLDIINKNKDNNEKLSNELIKKYEKFINDDRIKYLTGIVDVLDNERIVKIDNISLCLNEAVNIGIENLYKTGCISKKENINFKELSNKFGEYLFFDEKILFLYEKDSRNCLKTGISIIINKNIKVKDDKTADILFLLTSKNKIEHILCISDIMKLIKNRKIYEILNLSKKDIFDFIVNSLKNNT